MKRIAKVSPFPGYRFWRVGRGFWTRFRLPVFASGCRSDKAIRASQLFRRMPACTKALHIDQMSHQERAGHQTNASAAHTTKCINNNHLHK